MLSYNSNCFHSSSEQCPGCWHVAHCSGFHIVLSGTLGAKQGEEVPLGEVPCQRRGAPSPKPISLPLIFTMRTWAPRKQGFLLCSHITLCLKQGLEHGMVKTFWMTKAKIGWPVRWLRLGTVLADVTAMLWGVCSGYLPFIGHALWSLTPKHYITRHSLPHGPAFFHLLPIWDFPAVDWRKGGW